MAYFTAIFKNLLFDTRIRDLLILNRSAKYYTWAFGISQACFEAWLGGEGGGVDAGSLPRKHCEVRKTCVEVNSLTFIRNVTSGIQRYGVSVYRVPKLRCDVGECSEF